MPAFFFMIILWLLLLTLPFFVPAHFYPLPTYLEESIAAILAVAFGCVALAKKPKEIRYSRLFFLWVAFGAAWLVSWVLNKGDIVSPGMFYLYIWLSVFFSLLGGARLSTLLGNARFVDLTARILVFSGLLYASLGIIGYYGFIKYLIPWIAGDHPRLMGVMAQPNLSAVYMSLSLASYYYLALRTERKFYHPVGLIFISIVVLASVLTGSRSLFLILLVQLLVVMAFFYKRSVGSDQLSKLKKLAVFPVLSILLSVCMVFVYPPVDRSISSYLTDIGFLDRVDSSDMLMSRYGAKGQPRLGEWRKVLEGYSIIDNKLFGVGPGSYSKFSVAADAVIENPFRNGRTWRNAHNLFLMSLVEWGWLGLFLVLGSVSVLIYMFIRCDKTPQSLMAWLLVASILTHNMVEFSLWHLQFLIVFMVLLGTQFKVRVISLSTSLVALVGVLPSILLSFLVFFTTTKDYLVLSYLFSKQEFHESDVQTFDVIAQSAVWRPYSRLIMYYRMNPFSEGLQGQKREVDTLVTWSPLNLVLMRQASLTAGLGDEVLACERIHRATELYPAITDTLLGEISFLNESGIEIDVELLSKCVAEDDR